MPGNFVDTNVLLYSFGLEQGKRSRVIEILLDQPVLTVQVLNESAQVMRKKFGFTGETIQAFHAGWVLGAKIHPLSLSTVHRALELGDRLGYSHYDSLIIASALEAGCDILYSEDMQHNHRIDGALTIVNPFAA
jgi:predicted nucleic acid-binding protein